MALSLLISAGPPQEPALFPEDLGRATRLGLEGRIHCYKGHAVRKNGAAAFAAEAFARPDRDAWETVFELGRDCRPPEKNDLVPLLGFRRGGENRVAFPTLAFSREVERLYGLRRPLAIYRMVFGQSRQEEGNWISRNTFPRREGEADR